MGLSVCPRPPSIPYLLPQELQGQVALQQIALPLHEAETREKGLATLPALLWAEDGTPIESFPRLNMNRASFIDELCKHATPAEMVGHSLMQHAAGDGWP